MFRPLTFITLAMACGSGLYLYQVKHQAQVLDRQIERAARQTEAARAQARELNAAWTLLGNPSRLQQLSDQYLTIQPVKPTQFVAMADLDAKLPAPRPLDSAPSPLPPADADPDATIPITAPSASTVVAPAAQPAPVADTQGSDKPPAPAAAPPAAAVPAKPPLVALARPVDRPAEHKPADTPRPTHDVAQVAPPRAASPRPAPRPAPELAELDRAPRPAVAAPVPMSGSLLGMAHASGVAAPPPRPIPLTQAGGWGN